MNIAVETMTRLTHNGNPVDEQSQIILQILRDRREPMTTGELRRQTDLDQNQQVRYRLETHLTGDAGLVEHAGKRETPGEGPDSDLWEITEEGMEWADEHADDLEKAADAAQAIESLKRTRKRVDELHEAVEEFEKRIDGWQDTMNERSKRINQIENQTEDWKDELTKQGDEAWNKAHSAEETAENAEETVSKLENELADLQNDVEDLREDFEGLTGEISGKLERASSRIEAAEEQGERAEQIARRALSETQKSWTTKIRERLNLE